MKTALLSTRGLAVVVAAALAATLGACGSDNTSTPTLDTKASTVTVSKATGAAADGKEKVTINVVAVDTNKSPMKGLKVVFTATGTGNTLTQPTATTDANGKASGTIASTKAETKTITTTVDGKTLDARPTVAFVTSSKPVASLAFTVDPSTVLQGQKIAPAVEVSLLDDAGQVTATTDAVTLKLGANPGTATLGGTLTVAAVAGVATFADLTLDKLGAGYTLVASTPAITTTATSKAFDVTSGNVASLAFTNLAPTAVAGVAFGFTLTAQDAAGGTVTSYLGTVTFTCSDTAAVGCPVPYTFTATDKGTHDFTGVTYQTAGPQTLNVTDGTLTATGNVAVQAGQAAKLDVSGLTNPFTAGSPGTLTVKAQDAYGNTATGYTGTVKFEALNAPDPQATLPTNYTFLATDSGTHDFTASLKTIGKHDVVVTDVADATITGMEAQVNVVPAGSATQFKISGIPATVTAGKEVTFTVTAIDGFNNTITTYNGQVGITATPVVASDQLPAPAQLTAGVGTFKATLKKVGARQIKASDNTISGTADTTVTADVAAGLLVTGIQSPIASGVASDMTVTAVDAYGNTVTGYLGKIHFTSSDALATLPGDYTFLAADAGVHLFAKGVTLVTANAAAFVQATDTVTATINGKQTVQVTGGGATKLGFGAQPLTVGVNQAITPAVTVLIQDASGNTVATATDSVKLTLAGGTGTLGGTATRNAVAGVATFNDLTVSAAGTGYTLTATSGTLTQAVSQAFAVTTCPTGYTGPTCTDCDTANHYHKSTSDPTKCVDACTEPMPCTTVPQSTCKDLSTQTTFQAKCTLDSTANGYTCTYPGADVPCGTGNVCLPGSSGGACVADPCVANPCTVKPPTCADGTHTQTYTAQCTPTAPGARSCQDVTQPPTACGTGNICYNGACEADPCATPCTPKASTCIDLVNQQTWTAQCTVVAGAKNCTDIQAAPFDCSVVADNICNGGSCVPGPCAGTNPCTVKAPTCNDLTHKQPYTEKCTATSTTLFSCADVAGTPVDCSLTPDFICNNGACAAGPCAGTNPCTVKPPVCADPTHLTTYTEQCTATSTTLFSCTDVPNSSVCPGVQICLNAACIADPCTPNPCTVKAPTCSDGTHQVSYTEQCTPTGVGSFSCLDVAGAPVDCSTTPGNVCFTGVCQAAVAPVAGDLMITEIMHSPSGGADTARWFEVHNLTSKLINLNGIQVTELVAVKTFTVGAALVLGPNGYLVFGGSADIAVNGGVPVDYAWTDFTFGPTGHIKITLGAVTLDDLTWGAGFPNTAGKSMNFSSKVMAKGANAHSWYWCDASQLIKTGGDLGTPGKANDDCGVNVPALLTFCITQFPAPTLNADVLAPTTVYGQFYQPSATDRNTAAGQPGNDYYPFITGELIWGTGADASVWTNSVPANFNPGFITLGAPNEGRDEMMGTVAFPAAGDYLYGYRFTLRDPVTLAVTDVAYCDISGKVAPTSGTWGQAHVTVGPGTGSAEIGIVRGSADGPISQVVESVLVTYMKSTTGTNNDGTGFFVQAEQTGPALYVQVDPATLGLTPPLAVGDAVSFTATTKASYGLNPYVTGITGFARSGTGNAVTGLIRDVNSVDITPAAYLAATSDALIKLTTTIRGAFASSGSGFLAAPVDTAALIGNANIKLRMPTALPGQYDLVTSCQVAVNATPLWSYTTTAQPSAWVTSDFVVNSCPLPQVTSASVCTSSSVIVSFDRTIDGTSLAAGGGQFSFDLGALTVSGAAVYGAKQVLVQTSPQSTVSYTIHAANTLLDTVGDGIDPGHNSATFTGGTSVGGQVVISQVYGGGGNTGAPYKNDFIELHNRSASPVVMTNWSVQYTSAAGTFGGTTPNLTAFSGTIPAGGYFLIQEASGGAVGVALPAADATGTINLSGTNGKVALVSNNTALTGSCPTGAPIVDFVGYGTANCSETAATPALSNTTAALRNNSGCSDTNNNSTDFAVVAPAPRNSATIAVACGCY